MMYLTIENKTLLYSMLAASMRFSRAAAGVTSAPRTEMVVEAGAIALLRQEMANRETALTEANVLAVIACAYSDSRRTYPLRDGRTPRQSFLRELQDLNIYGRMVLVEAHVQGLAKLITLLGGIHNLKTPGVAQLISL
jgi:hypothetical protein